MITLLKILTANALQLTLAEPQQHRFTQYSDVAVLNDNSLLIHQYGDMTLPTQVPLLGTKYYGDGATLTCTDACFAQIDGGAVFNLYVSAPMLAISVTNS